LQLFLFTDMHPWMPWVVMVSVGGAICASVEYYGGTQTRACTVIGGKIRVNKAKVLRDAHETGVTPRAAAQSMAQQQVRHAMSLQR
jgi:hypothetical protein